MGFWDFFRKRNKGKEEIENEKISVRELEPWLFNKKTEIKKQEKIFLKLIQERISQLTQEFEEEISVLKKIDVDKKKAEEKIKLIVKENLNNYIYCLEKLITRLKDTSEEKDNTIGNVIEKINSIFSDLEKRSRMSYEKATFLIGKEMEKTKESIRLFFKDLEKFLKENQDLTDKSKTISLIEGEIGKFFRVKKIRLEIEKTIFDYDGKINNLKKEIEIKEEKIEEIKKSEKFIEQEKKKKELKKKKEEIEEKIYNLREIINFKSLTNFFHIFEKEMSMIKAYKENFKQAFQKTNGEEIISLLQEAKLQDTEITKKIEEIIEKEKEIKNTMISKTGIEDLEIEIEKTRAQLDVLNSKKTAERKKYEKQKRNLNEIISAVKEELIKINVEVC